MARASKYFPNTAFVITIKQNYIENLLKHIAPKRNERGGGFAWKRCIKIHEMRPMTSGPFGVKWQITLQPYVSKHQNPGPQHDRPSVENVKNNITSLIRGIHDDPEEFQMKTVDRDSIERLPDRRSYRESRTFRKHHSESTFEEYY